MVGLLRLESADDGIGIGEKRCWECTYCKYCKYCRYPYVMIASHLHCCQRLLQTVSLEPVPIRNSEV